MTTVAISQPDVLQPGRFTLLLRYLRRNQGLVLGLLIVLVLMAFTVIGMLTIDPKAAYPLAVRPKQPPSAQNLFGTDFFGRDLYSAMVVGLWQTALIGVIAGALGTAIGVVLGFTVGLFRRDIRHGDQGHLPDPDAYPGFPDPGHHRRLAR